MKPAPVVSPALSAVKASSLHLPSAAFRRCITTNEARHWMRVEAGMSRSGSDIRQRGETLSARFNDQEADAVRQMADRAGTSVASVIRYAVLNQPIPRATRRPTVNHEMAARVLGELGRVARSLAGRSRDRARSIRKTRMSPPRFAISPRCARSAFWPWGASHDTERQPARRR